MKAKVKILKSMLLMIVCCWGKNKMGILGILMRSFIMRRLIIWKVWRIRRIRVIIRILENRVILIGFIFIVRRRTGLRKKLPITIKSIKSTCPHIWALTAGLIDSGLKELLVFSISLPTYSNEKSNTKVIDNYKCKA